MMGDIADYYKEQELDSCVNEELRALDGEFWRCKDGRRLRPREMTTEHLRNAIAMIERRFRECYEAPLFWEADEAEEWFLSVPKSPTISEWCPVYETMREELARR
jgi:hypothetical protein